LVGKYKKTNIFKYIPKDISKIKKQGLLYLPYNKCTIYIDYTLKEHTMKNHKEGQDHPEVTNVEHICDITPDTTETGAICDKINQAKVSKHKIKSNPKNNKKKR
jgi:hypothetical protein